MSDLFRSFGRIGPTPEPDVREVTFTEADAELLRRYKRFLMAHRMRESLWCRKCEDRGDQSGLRASVMDGKIDFLCRCTARRYRGQTF